jgi:hypothetical protein
LSHFRGTAICMEDYCGWTARESEPSNSTSLYIIILLMIHPGLLSVKVSMEVAVLGSGI